MRLLIWHAAVLTIANGALPVLGLKANSMRLFIRHAAMLAIAYGRPPQPHTTVAKVWDPEEKDWKKEYRHEEGDKMLQPPPPHPRLDPWPTGNPFFGAALFHLKNTSGNHERDNQQLRETARDYLRATTDLDEKKIRAIENTTLQRKDKYPASYTRKPDMWGIQKYFEAEAQVNEAYPHLKEDSREMAKLVLQAHESLSDLAKGTAVTDLIDAHHRAGIKELFQGDGESRLYESDAKPKYGTKEWKEYVDLLHKQDVIDEDTRTAYLNIQSGAKRRETVNALLKKKLEKGDAIPLKVLWDYGLPGWYQVQLDFFKTYAQLFNAHGRSGTKKFGKSPGDAGFKDHFYGDSLKAKHTNTLSEDYASYKEFTDPRRRLMDPLERENLEY